MTGIEVSKDGNSAVLYGASAIITTKAAQKPIVPQEAPRMQGAGGVAYWGDDNNYPNDIVADVKKTSVLSSALYWVSKAWYSGGLVYGSLQMSEDKKKVELIRSINTEIESFLARNFITTKYLPLISLHYITFWNVFSQLVLNPDRSKIIALRAFKSPWCRISPQDEKSRRNTTAYVNSNSTYGFQKDAYTLEQPLVDTEFMPVESLRLRSDGSQYIYKVSGPGLDEHTYPRAHWQAVRDSKWLALANQIPIFKNAFLKHQLSPSKHVEIHEEYWSHKYADQWDGFDAKEKFAKKKAEYEFIGKCLNDVENAGKGLFTSKWTDDAGTEIHGITITELKNEGVSGLYNEDSQEANSHILYAIGFSGNLIGATPSKTLGAGSGSDKNADWNILVRNSKPEQDMVLEVLNFVSQYNNWVDEKGMPIVFWFENYYQQTQNQVTPENRLIQPIGNKNS